MRLPEDGYFSRFTHVELARFFPDENRLKRIQDKKHNPVLLGWDEIYEFSAKYEDIGIYHSIRHYSPGDGGLDGPSLAPLHFDIDNKENPERAYSDTQTLASHLIETLGIPYEAVRVYFSGMKGYHLEIEPMAVRLNLVSENSAAIFRFVAEQFAEDLDIVSFDYAVYDPRRIWRLAGSRHQKTGLYKIPCKDLMLDDAGFEVISDKAQHKPSVDDLFVAEQQFSPVAARFFAEIVATYEGTIKQREENKLSNFLSQGFSGNRSHGDYAKEFAPHKLRQECPAVDYLIDKADKAHHLEHYERLFLCSLLTYTPEAVEYLHRVFSKCSDYNFHISDLHIQDWIRRREAGTGGRPYTCAKARSVGIQCTACEDLQPKAYKNVLGAEHIAEPSPVRFAYKYHEIGA